MQIIADFHVHSKYSRATSPEMNIPNISNAAKIKGIQLVGTGDFTHSLWYMDLNRYLTPVDYGMYEHNNIYFVLTTEVNNIYSRKGRTYKVHNLIFSPSLETCEKLILSLRGYGKLESDGRPILKLDSENMVELILSIDEGCMIIPAHAWTPHFSVFGSVSGFNSLEECFGKYTKMIKTVETGLSSDPKMNWRVSKLDKISLISNSDAHSPSKLGRECNVFEISDIKNGYNEIKEILAKQDKKRFLYTIEFHPEEGKYHFDGHRACNVRLHPKESTKTNNRCPKCTQKLTLGVLHRVEELSDRNDNEVPPDRIPYKNVIPLEEIIAGVLGVNTGTKTVVREYNNLVKSFGTEFNVLLTAKIADIQKVTSPEIVEGIKLMRENKVLIHPGYDGVYGEIKVFDTIQKQVGDKDSPNQLELF